MGELLTAEVRVYRDAESMGRAAARHLVEIARSSLAENDSCSIALSGGKTPAVLYRLLASEFSERMPWASARFFWGDERYVPHDDSRSNFRLFRETVLDVVEVPIENIHPMPTDRPIADDAARDYEALMRKRFDGAWPRFDAVLLGLGADGHTASLFPSSPALLETKRWVLSVRGDSDPPVRLTLTLPVLRAASNVMFLVTGREKAEILRRVIAGPEDIRHVPSSGARPESGRLYWYVDEAASSLLAGESIAGVRIVREA